MKRYNQFLFLIFLVVFFSSFNHFKEKIVFDFSLRNVDSKMVSTKDFKNAKGFIVIFTCNHCPFAKLYTQRMNDLNTKYSALDVPLLAINSMDTMIYEDETFELMMLKSEQEKFNFPYLHDPTQIIGKQFGAEHTPMAFVIWKEKNSWVIKYKGAIDNNGEHPELAKQYIAIAVDELLNNKTPSNPTTESFGCRIFYRNK
jgi:peroxiredoxin